MLTFDFKKNYHKNNVTNYITQKGSKMKDMPKKFIVGTMFFALLATTLGCKAGEVLEIESLEALPSKGPIIVEFYSPTCHACTAMEPVYKQAAHQDTTGTIFCRVSTEKHFIHKAYQKLTKKKSFTGGTPTFVCVNKRGKATILPLGNKTAQDLKDEAAKLQ